MENRPLVKSAYIALILIPFLALINMYSPSQEKAPQGYNSTIIAFEMVSNESELSQVLSPLSSEDIENIDNLNYVDFGFMLAYGFFLWLFMTLLAKENDKSYLKTFRWLAPVAVIADVIENVQLLKLSHFSDGGITGVSQSITLLAIFTWMKWLLLAFLFVIIGNALMKFSWKSKLIGALITIPFTLGLLALFTKKPFYEDTFATSIFGCFFLIFIYAILYQRNDVTAS